MVILNRKARMKSESPFMGSSFERQRFDLQYDGFEAVVFQSWVKQQAAEAVLTEPAGLDADLFELDQKRGAEIEAILLDLSHH